MTAAGVESNLFKAMPELHLRLMLSDLRLTFLVAKNYPQGAFLCADWFLLH